MGWNRAEKKVVREKSFDGRDGAELLAHGEALPQSRIKSHAILVTH